VQAIGAAIRTTSSSEIQWMIVSKNLIHGQLSSPSNLENQLGIYAELTRGAGRFWRWLG
jgi:hypothetical protein